LPRVIILATEAQLQAQEHLLTGLDIQLGKFPLMI
jgi:hypothetical protein